MTKGKKMENKACACCGQKTLDPNVKFFDVCPVCGWEDDPIQNKHPDDDGGANHISLNEAKKAYAEGKDLLTLHNSAYKRYEDRMKPGIDRRGDPVIAALA
jgi:hypothetical protein